MPSSTPPSNSQFLPGSRVTKKSTTGEGAIIRETFSLPPEDSVLIDRIRQRTAAQGVMVNRSEVVRAGLLALVSMGDEAVAGLAGRVPKMKTGRPSRQ